MSQATPDHAAPGDVAMRFGSETLDIDVVHGWLTATYWCPGISRERVERAFRSSTVVVGAWDGDQLVGVARAVTDTVRFAYLADVYVDERCRGRGVGREMVRALLAHPALADVDSTYLLTLDAHGVYERLGFALAPSDRLMVRRRAT